MKKADGALALIGLGLLLMGFARHNSFLFIVGAVLSHGTLLVALFCFPWNDCHD